VDRFCFEGFLPRKAGERARVLAANGDEQRTMIYFEAPHRLAETLTAMADAFGGDRAAAVCRELTKTYEEVKRGRLADLAAWAADGVRGEITVVVAGAEPKRLGEDAAPEELAGLVAAREAAGEHRKSAIAAVAAETGLPKRVVFDAVVQAKEEERDAGVRGDGGGADEESPESGTGEKRAGGDEQPQ
jgi:16S rRNA (cytidine1402-2'-O)-methyltransferase